MSGLLIPRPPLKPKQDYRMVHVLIRKTAKELAGAFYEHAAHANEFYAEFPNQGNFIQREWPRFIRATKEIFTDMLQKQNVSEADKAEIYEALLDNSTLPYAEVERQITGSFN